MRLKQCSPKYCKNHYINMKAPLSILKIGGKILSDEQKLKRFLKDIALIKGYKILIHGGGNEASQLCQQLGITTQMLNGRRITNSPTLEVVTMVYAGLINKRVVSQLQAYGCNAMGLSGTDGNIITSQKRPVNNIDFGLVGDIEIINSKRIINLLESGITPVFCSITHNGKGQLLNTNADSIATEIASAMTGDFEVNLKFCFEKEGVLANPEDERSIMESISKSDYPIYKRKGIISNGMIPKIDNAFLAKANGVNQVFIAKTEIL